MEELVQERCTSIDLIQIGIIQWIYLRLHSSMGLIQDWMTQKG